MEFFDVETENEVEAQTISCPNNGCVQAGCSQTNCTLNGCTQFYPCS